LIVFLMHPAPKYQIRCPRFHSFLYHLVTPPPSGYHRPVFQLPQTHTFMHIIHDLRHKPQLYSYLIVFSRSFIIIIFSLGRYIGALPCLSPRTLAQDDSEKI
jgi:hypothetical protein